MSDQPQQQQQQQQHGNATFVSPLPDSSDFEDQSAAVNYYQNFALQHGIVLVIGRSRTCRRGNPRSVDLHCDRGGEYRSRNTGPARRNGTGTRLIKCPFEWKVSVRNGSWQLRTESSNSNHNHQPDNDLSGHPYARRLNQQQLTVVNEMSSTGSSPREINALLHHQEPSTRVITQTINNARRQQRIAELAGRSPIQALVDELSDSDRCILHFKVGPNNEITHLFFAYKTSIDLIRRFGSTLLMDCTYKTNRFKMPLLQVVGVTSFWTTFFACFVFLAKEEAQDYNWALQTIRDKLYDGQRLPVTIATDCEIALLNAIRSVFPSANNVLCIWHIQKNLVTKGKRRFNGNDDDWEIFVGVWNSVVNATDVDGFNSGWEQFKQQYGATENDAVKYIEDTWMPFKELFGKAWTNRFLHMGATVTSRVESAHHVVKSYIKVSTGHLRDVQQRIYLAVSNQAREIQAQAMTEQIRHAHTHRIPLFENVLGRISKYALTKTLEQFNRGLEINLPPCTNSFTTTMGKKKNKKKNGISHDESII
jgi:hypothetical protein